MQILSLTPAGVASEGLDSTARLPGSTLALTPLPCLLASHLALSVPQFPHLSNRDVNAMALKGLLIGLNELLHVNCLEQRPAG